MKVLVFLLTVAVLMLLMYCIFLRSQIRSINRLLVKRRTKNTKQIVTLSMLDSQLNKLADNINQCLKAEEQFRLKAVNEEKELRNLIANISHDFRTPLTAIKGYLQLLDRSNLDIEQEEKLTVARKRCEELSELIEKFFEYSYLLDYEPKVEWKTINLTNLVTECFASVVPLLEEKELSLDLDDTNVRIQADADMTLRIVQNLIRNCLAHAKKEIRVYYEQTENTVIFHVANRVNENETIDVSRIFERFYVASEARKTTGLGLSIVKILIEQMEGKAEASLENGWIDLKVYFKIVEK